MILKRFKKKTSPVYMLRNLGRLGLDEGLCVVVQQSFSLIYRMLLADPLSSLPLSDACHSHVALKLSSSSPPPPPPLSVETLSSSTLRFPFAFTDTGGRSGLSEFPAQRV